MLFYARPCSSTSTMRLVHIAGILLAGCVGSSIAASPFPASAYIKAKEMTAKMNITQKIAMLHGYGLKIGTEGYVGSVVAQPELGIPLLGLEDGPQGVADLVPDATAFPSALTVAMSWDRELVFQWGEAMGAEMYAKGANVMLGPGTNLARVPWGGRVFEYLSGEDPVLGEVLLPYEIQGIQKNNIAANIKHLIMNNQEYERASVSANVPQRAFMELYTRPFQAAVDAGVASAMCSYNRINNTYACENNGTMGWLKDVAGFDGWIMSDWGATHSTIPAALSGLDQEMPDSGYFGPDLLASVQNGSISQAKLDDMVTRIFVGLYAVGMFDNPTPGNLSVNAMSAAHTQLSRLLAEQSTTLLKNQGNLLPLSAKTVKSVAVLGDAVTFYGGGSGGVLAPYIRTPYAAIYERLNGEPAPERPLQCKYYNNTDFAQVEMPCYDGSPTPDDCAAKCTQDASCNAFTWVPNMRCNTWGADTGICILRAETNGMVTSQGKVAGVCAPAPAGKGAIPVSTYAGPNTTIAAALAKAADVAIVSVGMSCSEGWDRTNLSLPWWQDAVVAAVAAVQPNTVVVARCPGACFMPWINSVPAVLYSLLPGQEAANALASVLFGDVAPSGKLPVSFPGSMNDTWLGNPVNPTQYPGTQRSNAWLEADYSEELLIGYRWYDSQNITPLFPFGHGLSYTTFVYSNLVVSGTISPSGGATIHCNIKNNGTADAAEVAQLYVAYPAAANEPPKALKNFEKVYLVAGSEATIQLYLGPESLQIWDTVSGTWKLVPGTYTILMGSSSRDIRLQTSVQVTV